MVTRINTGFGVDIEIDEENVKVGVYNAYTGETKVFEGLQRRVEDINEAVLSLIGDIEKTIKVIYETEEELNKVKVKKH